MALSFLRYPLREGLVTIYASTRNIIDDRAQCRTIEGSMSESAKDMPVTIRNLHDPDTDREYWRTKTPQERLQALEELRRQWMEMHPDVERRFQRVCTIIKRK